MNRSLNSLRLIAELGVSELEIIISSAHEKRFWRDQAIFSEGDPIGEIFTLLSGCVKLTQARMNGHEVILRLIRRGDFVGRVFGRDGGQFCSAWAVESCALLVWDVNVFESLLEQFPTFRRKAMHLVEEQLIEMEQRFWGASTQSIETRLSSELLRLANKVEQQNARKEWRIALSHLELAQLTGISVSAITHLLRQWQTQGILAIQRRAVAVHNLDALARLAESE